MHQKGFMVKKKKMARIWIRLLQTLKWSFLFVTQMSTYSFFLFRNKRQINITISNVDQNISHKDGNIPVSENNVHKSLLYRSMNEYEQNEHEK